VTREAGGSVSRALGGIRRVSGAAVSESKGGDGGAVVAFTVTRGSQSARQDVSKAVRRAAALIQAGVSAYVDMGAVAPSVGKPPRDSRTVDGVTFGFP
jgi:hypothetical protein